MLMVCVVEFMCRTRIFFRAGWSARHAGRQPCCHEDAKESESLKVSEPGDVSFFSVVKLSF